MQLHLQTAQHVGAESLLPESKRGMSSGCERRSSKQRRSWDRESRTTASLDEDVRHSRSRLVAVRHNRRSREAWSAVVRHLRKTGGCSGASSASKIDCALGLEIAKREVGVYTVFRCLDLWFAVNVTSY